MKRKMFFLPLLLAALLVFVLACKKGDGGGGGPFTVDGGGEVVAGARIGQNGYRREHVDFRWHMNYDWAGKTWGNDMVSQLWEKKFDITANMTAPDAIANEVLNLMIMANDLPDAIWMERDDMNREMSKMNLFYTIDELNAMVASNWYNENVPAPTQNHYAVDGKNYTIPNWVRMGRFGIPGEATGGNQTWMYVTKVYEAVGSPRFVTFEDFYNYAVAVRNANLTNHTGAPIIPLIFQEWGELIGNFFVCFGGTNSAWGGWECIRPDGTYGLTWEDPIWREAVMEANRWFREGLFPQTMLTQSRAEYEEILLAGRGGLIFYDHSQDSMNNFRRIIREQDPGNSVEVITYDIGPRKVLYLPAKGLPHEYIIHQVHGTLGWNGSFITRNSKNPGRVFELLTYMLSPMGSIEMTLGPQGVLWDNLDANGYPIMTKSPATLSSDEATRIGLWMWDLQGHANNVDNAKFAANRGLPPELRNWVETIQETITTPNLMLSDEFTNMGPTIDSLSDLGIQRSMIWDYFDEMLPQIIAAPTAAAANALFDQVVQFANANGMQEINAIYDAHWRENCAMQNGSIFQGRW